MSISSNSASRPTLLTTAALAEPAPQARRTFNSVDAGAANPVSRDATTPLFYILLGFIMVSLVFGLFPQ